MNGYHDELQKAAEAMRLLMDKVQVKELSKAKALDMTPAEAGDIIRGLGAGFVSTMTILAGMRLDLESSHAGCDTCAAIFRALRDPVYGDFQRDLDRLE